MKKLTDKEIIDSVLKGNVNDYTLIIDRYKHKAFSLLVNMLKNKMEKITPTDDELQMSFFDSQNENVRGASHYQ